MNRCSPVEMRKNLEVVEHFKNNGINFVAVPVLHELHKISLVEQAESILNELFKQAEKDESNE